MKIEQLACPVIEPVVSRGAAVAGLELAPFIVQLRIVDANEVEDVLLELARDPGEDVDQAVRIRRHKVNGRLTQTHLVHDRLDWLPPATRVARISEVAAADQPQDDPALVSFDRREGGFEFLTPSLAQALPVALGGARCVSGGGVVERDILQQAVQLVPLDLVGDEGRNQVVDVRWRGDQDRARVAAVIPTTASGGRFDRLPAEDVRAEHGSETLWALAHHHSPAASTPAVKPA